MCPVAICYLLAPAADHSQATDSVTSPQDCGQPLRDSDNPTPGDRRLDPVALLSLLNGSET